MYKAIVLSGLMAVSFAASPALAQKAEKQADVKSVKEIVLKKPEFKNGKTLFQALKDRRTSREFTDRALDLQTLSDLLWAAGGINRSDGRMTYPTAMNSQEITIYAFTKEGVYLYDPAANKLILVAEGDKRAATGTQPFIVNASVNLLYVSDLSKMKGDDDEKKTILTALDTGHISQNVYLYCASANLSCVVRAALKADELKRILNLKDSQKIFLAQSVGYEK